MRLVAIALIALLSACCTAPPGWGDICNPLVR